MKIERFVFDLYGVNHVVEVEHDGSEVNTVWIVRGARRREVRGHRAQELAQFLLAGGGQ